MMLSPAYLASSAQHTQRQADCSGLGEKLFVFLFFFFFYKIYLVGMCVYVCLFTHARVRFLRTFTSINYLKTGLLGLFNCMKVSTTPLWKCANKKIKTGFLCSLRSIAVQANRRGSHTAVAKESLPLPPGQAIPQTSLHSLWCSEVLLFIQSNYTRKGNISLKKGGELRVSL